MSNKARAGFTVIEMVLTLAILMVLVLGLLALFDLNNKVARVQTRVAEMQQSLRVAQYDMVRQVRMIGRGGLPTIQPAAGLFAGSLLPGGVALAVTPVTNTAVTMGATGPSVLRGTDILTVRGTFNSPIYQVNPLSNSFTLDGPPRTKGTVTLLATTPTGVPQDLTAIKNAINPGGGVPGYPEALLLASPLSDDIYAVVELDPSTSAINADGSVTVGFKITNGTYTANYLQLSPGGGYPTDMIRVAYVAILEEYRYYIREEHDISGNAASDLTPKLSRARFYPGTDLPWHNDNTQLQQDIADNIFDLQVSLGIDTNGDQVITEGTDSASRKTDEWMFNEPGETIPSTTWNSATARLYYLRLTTLARTDRRDEKYQADVLDTVEDKKYSDYTGIWDFNSRTERMYRRQMLQTQIDLRNIS
jgi:hypothetical protein